jgi:hypothetical protein
MDGGARRRDHKAVPPDDVIVNVLDVTWQTPRANSNPVASACNKRSIS